MTITTSAPPPFAPPPFASPEDRGPLRFLPALLFEDRRPALTILVAWALTLAGSAWLLIGGRFSGASLAPPEGPIPWSGAGPAITALAAAALVVLVVAELRRERSLG